MIKVNLVRVATALVMILALVMSFLHIAEAFALMGAGWDRWTAPFLIDVVAIIGKIATGPEFTAPARRLGRKALYIAGTVSLICNVSVGYVEQKYGSALLGAIVICVALFGENMIAKLAKTTAAARKPRAAAPAPVTVPAAVVIATPAPAKPEPTAEQRAKWAEAGRKAAATRKANAAAKAAAQQASIVPQPRTATMAEDTRAYL